MTITIDPSNPASIRAAAAEVRRYQKYIEAKRIVFLERLAREGARVAQERFNAAATRNNCEPPVVSVSVENGIVRIIASGKEVGFLEFGTGVQHPEHSGTVFQNAPKHGTYGKGKGKRKGWYFYPTWDDKAVYTTGQDPAEAMTAAVERMVQIAPELAREVFSGD